MRPFVANFTQLAYETALRTPQRLPKDDFPLIPEDSEQRSCVPLRCPALVEKGRLVFMYSGLHFIEPTLRVLGLHLSLDKRLESVLQQIQRFADTFVIGYRHDLLASEQAGLRGRLRFTSETDDFGPALHQRV